MKYILVAVLSAALLSCGDDAPAAKPDPECEEAPDTAWGCPARLGPQRVRCVEGRYEVELCGASQWCIGQSTFLAQTTYEGQCLSRAIEGRCDAQGACAEGLICWRERCHITCEVPRDFCLLEGQRCIAASMSEGGHKFLCFDEAAL